ncbi:MAG: YtzI protein [Psychrobacillus sp.]
MGTVIIVSIIIFIIVLGLTIFTINKGYAFQHTIDERPEKIEEQKKTHPPE